MASFTYTMQGTAPTTIPSDGVVEFAGAGGFGSKVSVNAYQSSMHVRSAANADLSAGNAPKNTKFLTSGTVDVGGGSVALSSLATSDAPLKVNFAHGAAVITEDALFYAYDGATPADPPDGVDFRAAEIGDAAWTEAEGSAAALALDDQGSNTSHDFFLAVSASPTSVGLKTDFALRLELTYA